MDLNKRISDHQNLQSLQGKVQEIFIIAQQRGYNADRTIGVLKTMLDSMEEEVMDIEFRKKYGADNGWEDDICPGCGRTKKACQAANGSGCDLR